MFHFKFNPEALSLPEGKNSRFRGCSQPQGWFWSDTSGSDVIQACIGGPHTSSKGGDGAHAMLYGGRLHGKRLAALVVSQVKAPRRTKDQMKVPR